MRVICRTLNWSSTMRTLRAAAFGISRHSRLDLPSCAVAERHRAFLVDGGHCRCVIRCAEPVLWGTIPGQIGKLLDVEDEGNASVAEDGGRGNARNRAIALLDALDDDLLMPAQLVDHQPEPGALARLGDDDDAVGQIADLGG